MKLDKFVLAIAIAVILAYYFPQLSADNAYVTLNEVSSVGIALIFFFYGLKLSPEKIKAGLKNWKLHIVIQSSTFLIFPLIVLIFYPFLQNEQQRIIWLSVFFLAVLPSTVSSSVVMVSMAKGNIPAAIFNASISGIIGIFVTPLWMGLFLHQQQNNFNFSEIYFQLIVQIIIPVILGILLQPKLGKLATRFSKELSMFDKSIILLIVYKSFAESFETGIFSGIKWIDLVILFMLVLVLFFMVYAIVYTISSLFSFSREDKITALFCGSKKSLVHGTVFSKVLFSNLAFAGLMLLPLMLFHAFQLLIVSIIAGRFAREQNQPKKVG
ncbi:bile acid:sodium symporter family protein [Catalinimonas niigatensis]|uniref:bile acid:sodium symporter family protein n=1 Tax=Catalinimonas niigatensis TaxID=1397264 RepID=UPI00266619EB|nr:bile acid:sodium symporter family protein [Catalinimonas niigatensis]WPP49863.1 bile acid:sodium symporter family protein [Catalinimonas niigatensis]